MIKEIGLKQVGDVTTGNVPAPNLAHFPSPDFAFPDTGDIPNPNNTNNLKFSQALHSHDRNLYIKWKMGNLSLDEFRSLPAEIRALAGGTSGSHVLDSLKPEKDASTITAEDRDREAQSKGYIDYADYLNEKRRQEDRERQEQREDTAVQRLIMDMSRAGVNPAVISSLFGGSSGTTVHQSHDASRPDTGNDLPSWLIALGMLGRLFMGNRGFIR